MDIIQILLNLFLFTLGGLLIALLIPLSVIGIKVSWQAICDAWAEAFLND